MRKDKTMTKFELDLLQELEELTSGLDNHFDEVPLFTWYERKRILSICAI